jgi:hypothetical protein
VYGGVGQSIRLGTSELISREQKFDSATDLILIAICLFAGFYYLNSLSFQKKQP